MKKCFKCGADKPLDEFYKHPAMGDGYLGKCKECTKKDTSDRVARKKLDPQWVDEEMERKRVGVFIARKEGRIKPPSKNQIRLRNINYRLKYPQKKIATDAVNNAIRDRRMEKKPCEVCFSLDSEAHHEDYSKPLDVIWFCPKHHAERHVELRRLKRLDLFVLSQNANLP